MAVLSQRINSLTESQTIKMAKMGRELAAKGIDIINLSLILTRQTISRRLPKRPWMRTIRSTPLYLGTQN